MSRFNFFIIIAVIFFIRYELYGFALIPSAVPNYIVIPQDTLNENQSLYNGKIWRNLYYTIEGDQFLFSKEFLIGSLTMRAKTFLNIDLKYDIFKDELLTTIEPGVVLQLNKEMVDSFSLNFQNKTYRFIRIQTDSTDGTNGYFNVLYKGENALYLKYIKKIDRLTGNGTNDKFYQFNRLYFEKDNELFPITGKIDILNVLRDERESVKSYIKKNNIKVSEQEPESFIPVIRYFESIRH